MELIKRNDLSEGKTNKEKHVKPKEENPLKEKQIQLLSMQLFYHKESNYENCTKTLQNNEFNNCNHQLKKSFVCSPVSVLLGIPLVYTTE